MALEIEVKVLKGKDGKVNGISFVAGAETYSEDFIARFPRALREGRATLGIIDNKIVLEGPIFTGSKQKFEFKLKPGDLEGLKASVFAGGEKMSALTPDGMLTPGFRLTALN